MRYMFILVLIVYFFISTFTLIKPVSNDRLGDIIQCIQDRNYKIKQIKMSLLTKETAIQACQSLRDDQNLE